MAKWKRDVIYGIAILVACVAGVLATMDVKITGTMYWITRPDVYVWIWLAILAVLAVAMIIKAVIKKDETECAPIWSREGVVTLAALVLYLLLMKPVGFNITTFLFEAGLIIFYSWKMGKLNCDKKTKILRIVVYIVIAVVATIATKLLFTRVLGVRLPNGSLFK